MDGCIAKLGYRDREFFELAGLERDFFERESLTKDEDTEYIFRSFRLNNMHIINSLSPSRMCPLFLFSLFVGDISYGYYVQETQKPK